MKNYTKLCKIVSLHLYLYFVAPICATEPQPLISSIRVTQNSITVQAHPQFKATYLSEDFYVTYPDPSINLQEMNYSIVSLPFILNVISIVWLSGDTYYVDEMDRQLYDSLKTIRAVFQQLYPRTQWNGRLEAHTLVDNQLNLDKPADTHVALLFSHGLDSICSSLVHADKKQLLLTAYGHFDTPLHQTAMWQKMKEKVINFAGDYGHTYRFFESNYHNFLNKALLDHVCPEIWNWRLQAVEGLGWAGLVAPILLHTGYARLLVASSFSWEMPYAYAATPLIDDNLQFAGISVQHDGFDLDRAQKCIYIANRCKELGITKLDIRVCGKDAACKNCCKCGKCLRTIIGFLLASESLEDFGFPISNYEACARIKDYLPSIKTFYDYVQWIWLEAQRIAKNQQAIVADPELQDFFTWFKEYNLQATPLYPKYSIIQWKKMKPFHKDIPKHLTN